MKKKNENNEPKKLNINPETIRKLEDEQVEGVAGATEGACATAQCDS